MATLSVRTYGKQTHRRTHGLIHPAVSCRWLSLLWAEGGGTCLDRDNAARRGWPWWSIKNYLYVTNISSSLNHDDKFNVFDPPPGAPLLFISSPVKYTIYRGRSDIACMTEPPVGKP